MLAGPFLASSSLAISSLKAPTTAAELGSSGASAGSGLFQKPPGAKNRNGAFSERAGASLATRAVLEPIVGCRFPEPLPQPDTAPHATTSATASARRAQLER